MSNLKYKNILFIRTALFLGFIMLIAGFFCRAEIRNQFVDDTKYSYEIKDAAARYKLDYNLVRALIFQESRFNRHVIGKAGEVGLMQVLPSGSVADWARENKRHEPTVLELQDPKLNIEIGCYFLAKAMKRWHEYKNQTELALCQYNAGASRAKLWAPDEWDAEIIPRIEIDTTREYVEKIMARYKKYKAATKK